MPLTSDANIVYSGPTLACIHAFSECLRRVAMAIWLTRSWSLKTKKLLAVHATLMQVLCVCGGGGGLYLSLKLEPMLDCSIFPIKHIFNATQKSRYGTTKAQKRAPRSSQSGFECPLKGGSVSHGT